MEEERVRRLYHANRQPATDGGVHRPVGTLRARYTVIDTFGDGACGGSAQKPA